MLQRILPETVYLGLDAGHLNHICVECLMIYLMNGKAAVIGGGDSVSAQGADDM